MKEDIPNKEEPHQTDVELGNEALTNSTPSTINLEKSLQTFLSDHTIRNSNRKHLFIDFLILVGTVLFFGLLDMYAPPFERPFYTSHTDPNTGNITYVYMGWTPVDIFYPHTDNETFPDYSAFLLGLLLPTACFIILCFTKHRSHSERYYVLGYRVYGLIQSVVLTLLIVEIVKLSVGELRPDFLARCQPTGVPPVCTGDPSKVKEGRKSFPSGHSALMFTCMMYLSLILQHDFSLFQSLRWRGARRSDDEQFLLSSSPTQHYYISGRLLLALIPLLLAAIVAISRVEDNWHHPHDIFWGGVLGALVSYIVIRAHFYQPYGFHLLDALQRARHNTDKRGN